MRHALWPHARFEELAFDNGEPAGFIELNLRPYAAHGFTELTSDTNDYNSLSVRAHAASGFAEVERLICFRKKLR